MTSGNKPPIILTTSLGVALAANLLLVPMAQGETPTDQADQEKPKLVEWSTDEVKQYYDPNTDWNIPYNVDEKKDEDSSDSQGQSASGSSSPVIVHHSGFGWSDMMLYHMIFNSGRPYSTRVWDERSPIYDARTSQRYRPGSFHPDSFRNQAVVNSTVRPKTVQSSGSIIRRSSSKSSSSPRGSIGGRSGSFSSSGHSSGGGFFGG